jgi:plasmid stabilization system protein ParE
MFVAGLPLKRELVVGEAGHIHPSDFLFSSVITGRELSMARGSKAKYSKKQKRKAEHIEEGYKKRGTSKKEAERRAWATVNKEDKDGKKSGSGRGKKSSKSSSRKGGRKKH